MRGPNIRHARLRKDFAQLYPELPPEKWVTAGGVALRVAARVWCEEGAQAVVSRRLLPDEHFEFRGGQPRNPAWGGAPERLSDGR